jgi:alpha-L-rhamnosidase
MLLLIDKRLRIGRGTLLLCVAMICSMFAMAAIRPDVLRCEYLINPLGIDAAAPRLSWTCSSDERNQLQSAYEVIVSDTRHNIDNYVGNVWATGKLNGQQSLNIVYAGKALQSFTRYYWRVRAWDQEGKPSAWSEVNWFETAMLAATDWTAQWINDGSERPAEDSDYYKPDRMPLFRKSFQSNKSIQSARLYITGMGYFEAYINGKKLGDNLLDPGFTSVKKQVLYTVHDAVSSIKRGNNTIAVMLGNGWWNPLPFKFFGRWDLRDFQQTGRPCLKAALRIRYIDGTTQTITTDASWLTAPGPITRNSVYTGEYYDANLEQKGWSENNFDNTQWHPAKTTEGPAGRLMTQMQPPIRVTKTLTPLRVYEWKPGIFIADMGQNFAGVASIKVNGPKGTTVSLRYGETLFADGSVNLLTTAATQLKKGFIPNGAGMPENMFQEDRYTLHGTGVETWHPRFTFHGFRYIEISGWPGVPTIDDIRGLRMNCDMASVGAFSCSDSNLNKLHDVIQWTFLSNVFSVQSDCPGREKMGYGADIAVTAGAYMYNYDMSQFYRKTIADFSNDQQPDGGITEIAPFTGIADRGYGGYSGPLGWELVFPALQEQLYERYADMQLLEEQYPALQKQLAFLQSKAIDHLFYWDISDHEAIDTKPEALSASCFYYHCLRSGACIAGWLGKPKDSTAYSKEAQTVKHAIVEKYHVTGTGRFDNATQSAQCFALWYGLAPDTLQSLDVLFQELERHQWHVSTGIFSTKMLFDILREQNLPDIAMRIVSQRSQPGWLYMLDQGATTLWEAWHEPGTVYSANHPMFGSVDEWFYRGILGINPASAGFGEILIRPQAPSSLKSAKGSYLSVHGEIAVAWEKNNGAFSLRVDIPANTRARVCLPAKAGDSITESGKAMKDVRFESGVALIELGSGHYEFSVR